MAEKMQNLHPQAQTYAGLPVRSVTYVFGMDKEFFWRTRQDSNL